MKLFLFLCCFCLISGLYSQSVILFEEDSVFSYHVDVDLSDEFTVFDLDLFFKNNSEDAINLNWRREFGASCPEEWNVFSADQNIHYTPDVNMSYIPIFMSPGDSNFMIRQTFRPDMKPGCCDVKVIFSLDGDPGTPIDTGYYHIEINSSDCQTTAVDLAQVNSVNVYPNPASGHLSFESDVPIVSIELFDMLGKQCVGYDQQRYQPIDISFLASGLYFWKCTQSENIITTGRVFIN